MFLKRTRLRLNYVAKNHIERKHTLELPAEIIVLDHVDVLEEVVEAWPDAPQVHQQVVGWVEQHRVQEGRGHAVQHQGGGGGQGGRGVGDRGEEGGEFAVEELLQLGPVAPGLLHPLLVVVEQGFDGPVGPLHPAGGPVPGRLGALSKGAWESGDEAQSGIYGSITCASTEQMCA